MGQNGHRGDGQLECVALPIWQELLVGVEIVYLRISPVYWGFGVPHGDGSAVVVLPGFLGTDLYLSQLRSWLGRIGYKPYVSGIGLNADCPNLLMRRHLDETIERAWTETGKKKVHLIGHSLGGMLARAEAAQQPKRIASVITLATPIRSIACHPSIVRTAESVRQQILARNGPDVLPSCYTGACTCDFLSSVVCKFPKSVPQTAIYTKTDGVVDWRVCKTGNPRVDVEVSATHIGLVFSPLAYSVIAQRLADARVQNVHKEMPRAKGSRARTEHASRASRQHRRAS